MVHCINLTLFGVLFKNNITHLSTARRVGTNSLLNCEVSTVRTEPRSRLYSTDSTSQSIRSAFFTGRSGEFASLSSSVVMRSRTRWLTLFATSLVSCLELRNSARTQTDTVPPKKQTKQQDRRIHVSREGPHKMIIQVMDISCTLDSASVYQKVKPKISAVSPHNNRRRPYWSVLIIKKMLQETPYFSAFVYV